MKKLIATVAAVAVVAIPSAASAVQTTTPIPTAWGGGTASVDMPDFTYPADNGCYQLIGSLNLTGNNPYGWDYYTADLTVTDSIGRIAHSFYEFEDGLNTTQTLTQQICESFDAPGTYTIKGTVEFNDHDAQYNSYTFDAPVSDTFTISPYIAPPPPPVTPPKVNKKCVQAKKALKTAKQHNKPYKTIVRLKSKVKNVC